MKQLIVMISSILLGIFIFILVAGDGDRDVTVKSSLTNVWQVEIERQNTYP